MIPYRLGMGLKLENAKGKNLYSFWGEQITKKLNETLEQKRDNVVGNLPSDEYCKLVKSAKPYRSVINLVFLNEKNGKYKMISFYAKKAPGLMSAFIIKNRLRQH